MKSIKKERPVRSFAGEQWVTNPTNKKYLAIDFKHRCAYCDDDDRFNGEFRAYHVEHFAPKEKFPKLRYNYSNLLYACPYCNGAKSDKWPSDDANINVVNDEGFLDPCEDEYYQHLYRNDDGSIGYRTKLGKYIYDELNLGLKRHQIIYKQTELDECIEKLEKLIRIKKEKGEGTSSLETAMAIATNDFWHLSRSSKE